jgi:putative transposase
LQEDQLSEIIILKLVEEIRKDLPGAGVAKLHFLLGDRLVSHGIKIGRDGLYSLLGRHGYLIRYRRRKPYTTNSNHPYHKYPNLIKDKLLSGPGQLWVSDITYLRLGEGFCYLSIITDAYSHKIVGYKLHGSLHAQGPIDALVMAFNGTKTQRSSNLIHHSDRGVQYCCADYVQMIEYYGIQLSMTENGDPYENAIAERINGILKGEFYLNKSFTTFLEASAVVDNAVEKYNQLRPHASCDYLTPSQAHEQSGVLKKRWKKKVYRSLPVQEKALECPPGGVPVLEE